ncbi:MAG: hypothetical protein AABW79_00940 [Nanoarchaeota archaeon]
MEDTKIALEAVRDKSHDEALVKWAEFVRDNPCEKWKKQVDFFIDAVYQKADEFYARMAETVEGRKILERLKEERFRARSKSL